MGSTLALSLLCPSRATTMLSIPLSLRAVPRLTPVTVFVPSCSPAELCIQPLGYPLHQHLGINMISATSLTRTHPLSALSPSLQLYPRSRPRSPTPSSSKPSPTASAGPAGSTFKTQGGAKAGFQLRELETEFMLVVFINDWVIARARRVGCALASTPPCVCGLAGLSATAPALFSLK